MSKQMNHYPGSVPNGDTVIVKIAASAEQVSIIVSDAGSATGAVTNARDPDSDDALWSQVEWTQSAAAVAGPITGVRLEASGDIDYSIAAITAL